MLFLVVVIRNVAVIVVVVFGWWIGNDVEVWVVENGAFEC